MGRVHSGAPLGPLVSFGFVAFIYTRPGGRPAHLGSLCSIGRALVVVEFILVRPVGQREYSCSLGAFRCALGVACSFRNALVVVAFILVSSSSLWRSLGSFGFIGFIPAWAGGHRDFSVRTPKDPTKPTRPRMNPTTLRAHPNEHNEP